MRNAREKRSQREDAWQRFQRDGGFDLRACVNAVVYAVANVVVNTCVKAFTNAGVYTFTKAVVKAVVFTDIK